MLKKDKRGIMQTKVSFICPSKVWINFCTRAEEKGLSKSFLLQQIIKKYLEEKIHLDFEA